MEKVNAAQTEPLTPETAVLRLYQLGIAGCRQSDKAQAEKAIRALMCSLDFRYVELAEAFDRVYRMALDLLAQERFEQAGALLSELYETWQQALGQQADRN